MTPDASSSSFAALSLIVAPAILTNASSVLAMSTSNRLARAVDRARELARQLEEPGRSGAEADRRLSELTTTETRAILLLRVLRSFYTALAAFAVATLVSLLGAVAAARGGVVVQVLELAGVGAGMVAVGALVHGSVLLVRETRMGVAVLRQRAEHVRAHLGRGGRI